MKVILIHGKDTNPTKKWYPWLISELNAFGYDITAPTLPEPSDPEINAWMSEIDKQSPNEDTILIGHSRGGVAILRWLERLETGKKVRRVVLVATNSGQLSKMSIPSETNHGFYTEGGYDFGAIRAHCDEFVVLHSKDDPWVPFEDGIENTQGLDARFITFEDKGHFGNGVDEVPEILEQATNINGDEK